MLQRHGQIFLLPKENKREFVDFLRLSCASFPFILLFLCLVFLPSPSTFFFSSSSPPVSLYPCRLHSSLLCVPLKDIHERGAGFGGDSVGLAERLPCSRSQLLCIISLSLFFFCGSSLSDPVLSGDKFTLLV